MAAARPPCLQQLVVAHGGYHAISETAWQTYDTAIAAWHAAKRNVIRDEQDRNKIPIRRQPEPQKAKG